MNHHWASIPADGIVALKFEKRFAVHEQEVIKNAHGHL